jgi:CheY-like chemotaxis protein
MKTMAEPSLRVAVVDSTPQDYHGLLAAAARPGVSVHFLSSGNDSLRFSRRVPTVVWLVNTSLPDMSGFDLADMLRSIRPSALVFMIGDAYSLDDEMQALTLGLAKYLCKPLEPSWIIPQSRDFCIPMPQGRALPPKLRVVSQADNCDESRVVLPLPGLCEKITDEEVILPFHAGFPQSPAA